MADVGIPVLIRFAECVGQLILVLVLARRQGLALGSRFTLWDAQLYGQVAEHGYPDRVVAGIDGGLSQGGNLAFPPLFPLLERIVSSLTGMSVLAAGVCLAWAAGAVFSVGIHLLVLRAGFSRRAGYLACLLVGALPMSVVLQMGYPESLFAALTAWALIAADSDRWWLTGGLACAAGLTRPTGYVLVAGLLVLGWQRSRAPGAAAVRAHALRAGLLGVAGTLGFWVYVAFVADRPDGWFHVERAGWGTRLDFGREFGHFEYSTVTDPANWTVPALAVAVIMLGWIAVGLCVAAARGMRPYAVIVLVTVLTVVASTNFWHSRPRIMLGAAVVVVPLACWCGSGRRLRWAMPLSLAALGASWWFGAYMVTTWRFAI